MNIYNHKNIKDIFSDKIVGTKENDEIKSLKHYDGARVVSFNMGEYIVSDKAVITINTTDKCNAKCKFCYNQLTFNPESTFIDINSRTFIDTMEFCKAAGIKILAISGGEATLWPLKLLELLKSVGSNFEFIRLHTNGLNLMKEITFEGKTAKLYELLADYGVSDISLSLTHYDPDINNSMMEYSHPKMGPKEEEIEEVCRRIPIRLSCFLSKQGICNEYEAVKYFNWGRRLGVKKFVFRSSADIPNKYALNDLVSEYNRKNRLELTPFIRKFLTEDFKITYSHIKTDSTIFIMKKNDFLLDFSASSEELDKDYKIRRLILMQDGNLFTSWIDKDSKLSFRNEKHEVQC